jgi:hypothetical protein
VTLLAFAIIYFVWGSTFLAIRIGVAEVPPFFLAALRFLIAGVALYGWVSTRGKEPLPTPEQWRSVSLLAFLIFVCDYGLLFWAEQRVPSGIAAVMMALIPAFTALAEIVLLGTQRLTLRLALALGIGIAGVALLMTDSLDLGGAPVDRVGAVALIFAAASWSVASALARKVPLPPSKVMSSGAQMMVGGGFLADPPRIADQGGDLCVCEPRRGGAAGVFPGGRAARCPDSSGHRLRSGERGGDHDQQIVNSHQPEIPYRRSCVPNRALEGSDLHRHQERDISGDEWHRNQALSGGAEHRQPFHPCDPRPSSAPMRRGVSETSRISGAVASAANRVSVG